MPDLTPATERLLRSMKAKGPTPMPKQKAKPTKATAKKTPVTLDPVIRVLNHIIKTGRDVNPADKRLLADLVAKLKD